MILAFQNYILMLGTSVMIPTLLVPLMGGSYVSTESYVCSDWIIGGVLICLFPLHLSIQGDKARVIQTLLFVAGIKTLLQTLFGTRLPVIVGGSYAFVIPVLSIINDSSLKKIPDPHEVWSQDKLIKWCICLNSLELVSHKHNFFNMLQRFLQTMRAIQGALIVASSLQIILGYSQIWGIFSRYVTIIVYFHCLDMKYYN